MLAAGCRHQPIATLPDDAGTSLLEVLIAMVISLIVGSLTLLFLVSSVHSARRAAGQTEQAATARAAVASWSLLVPLAVDSAGDSAPGAVRFQSFTSVSARFCVGLQTKSTVVGQADKAPIGVELSLTSGKLVEKRWNTCGAMTTSSADVTRTIAPRVSLLPGGVWLLTPLAKADLPSVGVNAHLLTSTLTGVDPLTSTTPTGAAQIALIAGVQLAFATLPDPKRPAPSASYTTFLALTQGG